MAEATTVKCPNCAAPVTLAVGEVEAECAYCGSLLRCLPDAREMEVVRTRAEMKVRERVAKHQAELRKQLDQEEMEAWRRTAAKVAVAALPMVGTAAGRAIFQRTLGRGSGCLGCGCVVTIGVGLLALLGLGAALG